MVFMQGQRFWVERSFQDEKSSCGMADYQVRHWSGWHHHMAMVRIAMLFMAEERVAQQASAPLLSCADIVALLKHFLPPPTRSMPSAWNEVTNPQGRRSRQEEN